MICYFTVTISLFQFKTLHIVLKMSDNYDDEDDGDHDVMTMTMVILIIIIIALAWKMYCHKHYHHHQYNCQSIIQFSKQYWAVHNEHSRLLQHIANFIHLLPPPPPPRSPREGNKMRS